MGPEIYITDGDAAVTKETPFTLVVELLQNMLTVTWPRHHPGDMGKIKKKVWCGGGAQLDDNLPQLKAGMKILG